VERLAEIAGLEELRAAASNLNFDSTISRELVHRRFIDHVFVTDLTLIGDDHFLCAGRLPQMHGYFNEECSAPCCSIFAVSEITRQACIAISHRYLDVPDGYSQIIRSAGGVMDDSCDLYAPGKRSAEFLIRVRISNQHYRRTGELIGLTATYTGYSELQPLFHGSGDWMLVPKKMYKRLRHQVREPLSAASAAESGRRRTDPSSVGRRSRRHVVISQPKPGADGASYHADLIANPEHPYFFEHEVDHVPGMMLLEGCNQFAIGVTTALSGFAPCDVQLKRYEMRFFRFAGLEAPVQLEAPIERVVNLRSERRSVLLQITVSQEGVVLAEFDLTMVTQKPVERWESEPSERRERGAAAPGA